MDTVISIISQLGFPVAAAVAVFWFGIKFIENQLKQYADREQKLIAAYNANEDRFMAQLDKFSQILTDFNVTLNKIDARLEYLEKNFGEKFKD